VPDELTVGWLWTTIERLGLKPGDVGIIIRIEREDYVNLDAWRAMVIMEKADCCHTRARAKL
jgi:hypothetical protein